MTDKTIDIKTITDVFVLRGPDGPVWKAMVDGELVSADFQSKGGALASIPVERTRRVRRGK